eukprot:scpid106599/ scgid27677/ 
MLKSNQGFRRTGLKRQVAAQRRFYCTHSQRAQTRSTIWDTVARSDSAHNSAATLCTSTGVCVRQEERKAGANLRSQQTINKRLKRHRPTCTRTHTMQTDTYTHTHAPTYTTA